MSEYKWKSVNVSPNTYEYLRASRQPEESLDVTLRRLLGLTQEPHRPSTRRSYYPEDARARAIRRGEKIEP